DRGALAAQPRDAALEPPGHLIRIGTRTDDVVTARRDRDEVGAQLERRLDLLVEDLLQQAPTDREVRVGEVLALCVEHLGHSVGPSAVTARHPWLGVADALRERVADRDVSMPGVLLGHLTRMPHPGPPGVQAMPSLPGPKTLSGPSSVEVWSPVPLVSGSCSSHLPARCCCSGSTRDSC